MKTPFAALPVFTLVLGLGCSSAVEPVDEGLEVWPRGLDFGDVPLTSQATRELQLANHSTGEVQILSVSITQGALEEWQLDDQRIESLSIQDSTRINITFVPLVVGTESLGQVQIRTSHSLYPSITVPLRAVAGSSISDQDGDGFSLADADCDDEDPTTYPGAEELCDGIDNNCDELVSWQENDSDGDGYRTCDDDCNDNNSSIHPDAAEICDDRDSNCDGIIDDNIDNDKDGWSGCDGDCDDEDPELSPDAVEICDDADNDCNGQIDDLDADEDNHSPCVLGDCDDSDPDVHPVVVHDDAAEGGDGSPSAPYRALEEALAVVESSCPEIVLMSGTYPVSLDWTSGSATIRSAYASDPAILVVGDGERIIDVSGGTLTLQDLHLVGGKITGSGAAARVQSGTLVLSGTHLREHFASGDGGAVLATGGSLVLDGASFSDNQAAGEGGALAVRGGSLSDGGGSSYSNNSAASGGAILLEDASGSLADAEISANTAEVDGGGILVRGGDGLVLERLWVVSNMASTGGGLSVIELDDGASVIRNGIYQDNVALENGGGVSISGSSADFVFANNTLIANQAVGQGGGLDGSAADASGLYIWSNVVGWNQGESGLALIAGSDGSVSYNLLYGTDSGTELVVDELQDQGYNDIAHPNLEDFSDDANPDNDDLRPASGSPAIDAGPPDGEGPAHYTTWRDPDSTSNDRGYTGGPGAQ